MPRSMMVPRDEWAGGGCAGYDEVPAVKGGDGGRGEVRISWGSLQERENELQKLATDPEYLKSRYVSNIPPKELLELGIILNVNKE